MRFNSFLWNTFLESAQGREWVEFFSSLKNQYANRDKKLASFIASWASHGTLNEHYISATKEIDGAIDALDEILDSEKEGLIPNVVTNRDQANTYFEDISTTALVDDEDEDNFVALFGVDDIPRVSVALFCLYPKYFFPYYFYPNFHALKNIFDEFGIFMPPVPPKRDYDARFNYYLELCKSLSEFWINLGLAPEHIPVFLYGFAPQVLNLRSSQIKDLPRPHRAWFVGGGINSNGDFDYLDKVSGSSQTFWQGNKETEEGDIVVMYCLAPRSCVHSIWRAVRPGGIEPFRGYYQTIWIGCPQLVEPLTYTEMKSDPVLSQMPLIKGNMQGINGRQIPKQFYDRLLFLLEKKGTALESLPQLEDMELKSIKLKTERDVETNLLEPLLAELGFHSADWERQVSLRVGRGEKVIPDYLIHLEHDKASKSVRADWVWEAKLTISSHEQLQKDFGQVCSYARLVGASGVGLISKEGLWLCSKKDDYVLKSSRHWSAKQMRESDSLSEIRMIAGKMAVRSKNKNDF